MHTTKWVIISFVIVFFVLSFVESVISYYGFLQLSIHVDIRANTIRKYA